MKRLHLLIQLVICLAVVSTGCQHKRTHGLFARDDRASDSSAICEVLEYQRKASEAENTVIAAVKADSTNRWVQHEFGWWYRYIHVSDDHDEYGSFVLKLDTCYLIHEVVYDLNGTFVADVIRVFDAHREEGQALSENEPFAYQFMLPDMSPSDTVMLLIPWYLAYGPQGNTYIPEYANIRVLLTLHNNLPYDARLISDVPDVHADTIANNDL